MTDKPIPITSDGLIRAIDALWLCGYKTKNARNSLPALLKKLEPFGIRMVTRNGRNYFFKADIDRYLEALKAASALGTGVIASQVLNPWTHPQPVDQSKPIEWPVHTPEQLAFAAEARDAYPLNVVEVEERGGPGAYDNYRRNTRRGRRKR